MSSESPRPKEEQFIQFPMLAFDDLPDLTESEMKVLIYVIRQTKNYDRAKWIISLDEFQHGRLRQDGTRMDRGTGLSQPAIIGAIRSLKTRRYLFTEQERAKQISYGPAPWLEAHISSTGSKESLERSPSVDDSPRKDMSRSKESLEPFSTNFRTVLKKVKNETKESLERMADGASQEAARRVPTDTSTETLTQTRRDTIAPSPTAQAGADAPHVSHSQKEDRKDELPQKDALFSKQQAPLQANNPPKRHEPTEEEKAELARRAAELEEAERQRLEAKQQTERKRKQELRELELRAVRPALDKARKQYEELLQDSSASERKRQDAYDLMKYYERYFEEE